MAQTQRINKTCAGIIGDNTEVTICYDHIPEEEATNYAGMLEITEVYILHGGDDILAELNNGCIGRLYDIVRNDVAMTKTDKDE